MILATAGEEKVDWWAMFEGYEWHLLLAGGLLILLVVWSVWWRKVKRHKFPTVRDSGRLSARSGAAIGGVLEFHKKTDPPCDQRKRLKDNDL